MDSGNSGSLQSSSGDDELDAACGVGADSSPSLAALLRHQGFDGGGVGGSSLIYGLQDLGTPPLASSHWSPTTPAPLPAGTASASPPCHGGLLASSAPAAAPEQTATAALPAPRGSRKRARASRRAPTTVLTTDTSNFRAMVQEFTGIPAPPFAAARSRFDHHYLFPSRSSAAAAIPQYLLRPFTHKLHHAYPPAPADATIVASTTAAAAGATAVGASGDGYHQQQQQQLTAAAPPHGLLGGMQDHSGGINSSFLSSFQSTLAAHLAGGNAKYPRLQDSTDLLGVAHGVMTSSEGTHLHLHQRNGDRGDELSGLVGGCKATYSAAPPPLEHNGASTSTTAAAVAVVGTAAMRTQGVESWLCNTSQ